LNAPTSLVASAARAGQIVRVDNVRESADWLPDPLLPDTYSEMAVPIVLEGEVVGILDVQQDKIAGLDEGDANLLRSLANQVAVTIRNARLFDEVETALTEAHATQKRYLEQAWQKSSAQKDLRYHYSLPNAPDLDKATLTQVKQTALTQTQTVTITLNNPSDLDADLDKTYNTPKTKSIVSPIKLYNQNIGAVQIHPASSDQTWTEADLALAEAVIDQLAQSAESLRLFEETRERAEREHTIRAITDKLRAAPNLDTLLETAARELGARLGVRHTVLEMGIAPEILPHHGQKNRSGNGPEELEL
jgi:GAF domain-containing protein